MTTVATPKQGKRREAHDVRIESLSSQYTRCGNVEVPNLQPLCCEHMSKKDLRRGSCTLNWVSYLFMRAKNLERSFKPLSRVHDLAGQIMGSCLIDDSFMHKAKSTQTFSFKASIHLNIRIELRDPSVAKYEFWKMNARERQHSGHIRTSCCTYLLSSFQFCSANS